MSVRIEKLGNLLFESRIPAIDPNPDKGIRVKLNVLGIEKRPFENEIAGATKQFIRKSGQFIYGKQNFHKGAFGIVPKELDGFETSADIPSFDLRKDCLAEWIYYYFKVGNRYLELEKIARGVGSKRIHPEQIADIEIPLPSIEVQNKIIRQFKLLESNNYQLDSLIRQQLEFVKQLRQAFLREAMEGKLVEQDSADEPASDLLRKIKVEKEKLIADKKLKKEKELPAIKEEEIPFKIPENWVWCRLGEICMKIHYGLNTSAKPDKKEIRLLRITDIQNNKVDWESVPGCEYSASDLINYLLNENDIVIARTGGTIGKTFIVKNISVKSLFASYLIRAIPSKHILPEFIKSFLESPLYWTQLYDAAWGAGQPNVNGTSLSNLIVSLPPLPEQHRIVAKLEQMMESCDALEASIKASMEQNERLLQQVLREALRMDPVEV
jgi:type I restriction enzyme S subunit